MTRPRGLRATHAPLRRPLPSPPTAQVEITSLRAAPRLLRASRRAVDLAAIAAAADQHLGSAQCAQKKPRRRCRFGQPWAWTRSATGGILPRHSCPARCGARRRSETWPLRVGALPALETEQIVIRAQLHRSAVIDARAQACGMECRGLRDVLRAATRQKLFDGGRKWNRVISRLDWTVVP